MDSENTYGARLLNSEKLMTTINSYTNYQAPLPELETAHLQAKIIALKAENNSVAVKKQNYSLAVDFRQGLFKKNENSIQNLLSPINGVIKAVYGRRSKEATDIATIISKIRSGNGTIKKTNPDDQSVSQSHLSFGSKIQYFSDLIANLENLGNGYNPINLAITLQNLNTLRDNASVSNQQLTNAYTEFKQSNTLRIQKYEEISHLCLRFKDNIKAQYGNASVEYKLVKGLKI